MTNLMNKTTTTKHLDNHQTPIWELNPAPQLDVFTFSATEENDIVNYSKRGGYVCKI